MKACVLTQPRPVETCPLRYSDVPIPEPIGNEVLIRVHTCGVCRSDLHVVEGELPERKRHIIPGHQVVGTVEALGEHSKLYPLGIRVGIPWLHRACGTCRYCSDGVENLCERAEFTGYTANGGYAEYMVAPEDFAYKIPDQLSDVQAAPLLCAGIAGFRRLRLSGVPYGGRLGIYGLGEAGHVALQVARHWGMSVYVCTHDARQQKLAAELGATWVGSPSSEPPVALDGSIVFAPVTDIPRFRGNLLHHEPAIPSVANITQRDGEDFLKLAASIPIRTNVEVYPLSDANRTLQALKNDLVRGAAVLTV